MNTKLNILLLLFCGIINAQVINGKILDVEYQTPISFAKIGIENTDFGTISDEDGNFSFDFTHVDKSKNLIIEYTEYESFTQNIQDFINSNNYDIYLIGKVTELEKITISPKKLINKTLGIKTKSKTVQMGLRPNENGYGKEFGLFFRNKKRVNIQKININLAEFKLENPLLVKFNIYSEENKLPGEVILDENLTVSISQEDIIDDTFTLDVSDKSIWINKENFFVTIQILDGHDEWIYLSGALLKTTYERNYYSPWEKITIAGPAINIDVRVEK